MLVASSNVGAVEIRIFSGGAPQRALGVLAPEFEEATGHKLQFTFALVTAIQTKLAEGEQADLVMLPVPLIAATEKMLPLRPEGRTVLARVGISIIVRAGAPRPDISTLDSVRGMLLAARAIAVPDPGTPSGGHLDRMIAQMGIADEVRPKVRAKPAIHGGAELVANGEADLGMYLLSEVHTAKGIAVVGLLPAQLQSFVVYGTAIPASNHQPEAALDFVKFVSQAGKQEIWKTSGFELMGGGN